MMRHLLRSSALRPCRACGCRGLSAVSRSETERRPRECAATAWPSLRLTSFGSVQTTAPVGRPLWWRIVGCSTPRHLTVALLFSALIPVSAAADTIIAGENRIESVQVQTIHNGRIYYLNSAGALQNIQAAGVSNVLFDGFVELSDAARYESRGELEDALDKLLVAMSKARTQPQRVWLHARLARIHATLGDLIEAAGHFGALIDEDASEAWLPFAPQGELNEATFYSAGEATWYLRRAARRTHAPELTATINDLLAKIEPVFEEIAKDDLREYRGGSTISGILLRDIGKPRPGRSREAVDNEAPLPQPIDSDAAGGEATPSPPGPADSPGAIDALLSARQFREALALCERLVADPGERDLAQFLYQYGRALAGANRPRDAAVKLARAAIEFPSSPFAPLSWIELAGIYHRDFNRPAKARELLELAAATAAELGELDTANLARQLLQELVN